MLDYLIIGRGLAGSLLGWFLWKEGKKIKVVDRTGTNSSKVAAGLYNPVTGRKMVRTWKADELFSDLERFYQGLEDELQSSFLVPRRIYRPFLSMAEQNDWQGRSADPLFRKFIYRIHTGSLYPGVINDPYGGLELASSGYLDTELFLDALSACFQRYEALINDEFDFKDLKINEGEFEWKGLKSKNVIFCQGIESRENPYFSWLPFQPLKGELIHIRSEVRFDHIINRGVFLLETSDGIFKVGSTYNRRDPFSGISEEGKSELIERLKQIFRSDFTITDHYSGIRPATRDRRPILGVHPEIKNMWIFNGLGTKGVSLGPYFAKLFKNYLVNNKALDPIVNINRYYSLYYQLF